MFFSTLTSRSCTSVFFFFNDTATTEIYTLSLHDALPISRRGSRCALRGSGTPIRARPWGSDRKSTRLNSSHGYISYAVFCLKKKNAGPGAHGGAHALAAPSVALLHRSGLALAGPGLGGAR